MVCLHFSEAVWLVFCFLPSSPSTQTPWAQQQTALNEPEIFSDNIFLLSNVWLYLFFIHWLLESLPAVLCQWKHAPQWMANSTMALNSGQISQSLAGRSCLENAQGRCISWVQPWPWLGAPQCPDPDGYLWRQKLPGLPPTTNELLKYTPSFSSLSIIEFFFISRYGHCHAWVFYFYSAFFVASSCLLLIFLCFISHLHGIFLRGHFFLMFYIQAFSFVGLIFVLWASTCFLILLLLLPFFLLLLPFPSAWPYSLDCYSQPLERHFLLALILNYLFHVRLTQMAFGIQISRAWYCELQSSSREKNLIKAKKGWTTRVLQVVCRCTDGPCRAIPAPPAWQKRPAIVLLLASLWLPLPVGTCRLRHRAASGLLAESGPLYAGTRDVLPWLFPCSWQMQLPLLYV